MAIVKSSHLIVEHFRTNYLTEEEETIIIARWPALHTRLVRQKAISPNNVFSNLLAVCLWVEFVGSLLCTERFSPGTLVSPLLKNQHLT